jgi:5-methylcytosine-specific restriction protein A
MPTKPKRPCKQFGCPELVESGQSYCDKHKKTYDKDYERKRGTAHQRGYTKTWSKYRLMYLRENPICVMCQEEGNIVSASVVDHIIPHKGNMDLFWDSNNHQALCKRHHDIKTVTKDGGFGKKVME